MSYEQDICIVGIGTSQEFGFDLRKSPIKLQIEAVQSAIDDSGLVKGDLDGFITASGSPRGVDYDEFVLAAGLDCRWISQMWTHGRWATTTIVQAALALSAGLASAVLIANTSMGPRGYSRHLTALGGEGVREGLRDVGSGQGKWDVHGIDTPGSATALVAQRYMERYGATDSDLAAIATTFRANALQNPIAVMRNKPMTIEAYFREPVMATPFRRADYCLANDGSTALILTTRQRAKSLRQTPVIIAGFEGIKSSREDYILFARPGLGAGISGESAYTASTSIASYEMSGVGRSSIGALYMYDSFTSNLWMVLERFGFCGEGEGPSYVKASGIDRNSAMPINTNGGLLSEGHQSGYAHIIEMVRQLRGQADLRQLHNIEAVQWATPWGDSLILRTE